MKAVSFKKPFQLSTIQFGSGASNRVLLPHIEYVLDDMAAEYALSGAQDAGASVSAIEDNWDIHSDARTRLLFCPGGIGDAMMVSAIARQIHEETGSEIYVATSGFNAQVFCDYVNCFDHPMKHSILKRMDNVLTFEGILDLASFRSKPYIELFAEMAGIGELRYKVPQCRQPSKADRFAVDSILPKSNRVVGIHLKGSMWPKNYPLELNIVVAGMLARRGYKVVLLGAYHEMTGFYKKVGEEKVDVPPPENIINLCGHIESFGQMVAVAERCECIICPDSAFLHICGAYQIPCIFLSGPVPADLRAMYYPCVNQINGIAKCAPCYATITCPLYNTAKGACEAMASITPLSIVETVERIL